MATIDTRIKEVHEFFNNWHNSGEALMFYQQRQNYYLVSLHNELKKYSEETNGLTQEERYKLASKKYHYFIYKKSRFSAEGLRELYEGENDYGDGGLMILLMENSFFLFLKARGVTDFREYTLPLTLREFFDGFKDRFELCSNFVYPFVNMTHEEMFEHNLCLYYDSLLKDNYDNFPKKFINMLESDLRELDLLCSKEKEKEEESELSRFEEKEQAIQNRKRNLRLFMKDYKSGFPNNTRAKQLVSIYYNAICSLTDLEKKYIDYRLRINTAWCLYFVITLHLPMTCVFPCKNEKQALQAGKKKNKKLNEKIDQLISIIASIQDGNIRMLLIEILNIKFSRPNVVPIYSNDFLDQLISEFYFYTSFVTYWEKIRENIFDCKEYQELLVSMMDTQKDQIRQTDNWSVIQLKEAVDELKKGTDYNKSYVVSSINAFIKDDPQAYQPDLFTKIWKICYSKVPKIEKK